MPCLIECTRFSADPEAERTLTELYVDLKAMTVHKFTASLQRR